LVEAVRKYLRRKPHGILPHDLRIREIGYSKPRTYHVDLEEGTTLLVARGKQELRNQRSQREEAKYTSPSS